MGFGDGDWAITFGIYTRTYHLYSTPGLYTITLETPGGLVNTSQISVTDASLAGLSISVLEPVIVGQPTHFEAVIAHGIPTTYSWDMGDGTMLSGALVTHTYSAYGMFTVTLTATDGMSTLQTSLIVGEPLRQLFLPTIFVAIPPD